MTGESTYSYIRRLARANHLRPAYLRRYLHSRPGANGTIHTGWLAALAGRPQSTLEHALTDLDSPHHPRPAQNPRPRRNRRPAGKPALYAAIRQDARDKGMSIRALADRHGVHRRTVHQALDSPAPPPRKRPAPRPSRLDPFKDTIDAILLADRDTPPNKRHTTTRIHALLTAEHNMNGISYSTLRDYITNRRPATRSRRTPQDQ
jgi:pyruvate/2-oxoglutarate dehydrogenase complex dihydrolipoamide acyltransferase (E2) component